MVQGRKQPHQVGQSLYKTHEFYKNKAKQREQNEIDNLAQRRHIASKANDKSDKIIQQARRQQLGLIFDRMDSDNDQQISSTKINLRALDAELYNAFKPLLNELEHLGQSLDKDEFVESSLALISVSKTYNLFLADLLNRAKVKNLELWKTRQSRITAIFPAKIISHVSRNCLSKVILQRPS